MGFCTSGSLSDHTILVTALSAGGVAAPSASVSCLRAAGAMRPALCSREAKGQVLCVLFPVGLKRTGMPFKTTLKMLV